MPLEEYLNLDFEVIPIARVFVEQIFCSGLETKEKINLIWDTLSFFEHCDRNQSDLNCYIQMDTCRYFANYLIQKLCPSVPLNSADNLTDIIFCGDAPTIYKAFLIAKDTFLDIKELLVSCVNHSHLISGKKELDFSKPIIYSLIKEHVVVHHRKLTNLENAEIYLEISSNLGIESHTLSLQKNLSFHNLRSIFKNQVMRIPLVN